MILAAIRLTVLGGAVICVVAIALWSAFGVDEPLTRDVTAAVGAPPWTGAMSTLGLVAWGMVVGVFALASTVVNRDGNACRARFFTASALLFALLAVDDALLLHDDVLSERIGIPETAVYVVLIGLSAAWLLRFRHLIRDSDTTLFGAAAAGFAASVLGDFVGAATEVEDGAKYAALIALVGWTIDIAGRYLSAAAASASAEVSVPRSGGTAR